MQMFASARVLDLARTVMQSRKRGLGVLASARSKTFCTLYMWNPQPRPLRQLLVCQCIPIQSSSKVSKATLVVQQRATTGCAERTWQDNVYTVTFDFNLTHTFQVMLWVMSDAVQKVIVQDFVD